MGPPSQSNTSLGTGQRIEWLWRRSDSDASPSLASAAMVRSSGITQVLSHQHEAVLMRFTVRSFLITASSLWLILASSVSASAQTISESQMRAANLARMQAELINGGGKQYSPANCMHQGGGRSCMISNTVDGFRFRILGGAPGWAARDDRATIETVVFISPDGKISKVEYNGPVRQNVTP